ncbi:MAG: heavy-metal-associated domain-containing protein [Gemmataceae bacterium]|nr:heavy-metal-associated domain-containing protein [Gemmataceae bacterium]
MTTRLLAAATAALVLLSARGPAADPPPPPASTLTVPEMDCAGCAKKLGEKLAKVPGAAKVEYDVKGRTLKVTHKVNETPSPKALWEAVEKEDKAPSKLQVPGGTYTKKPAK